MAENISLLFMSHKMLKIMKHHYDYMYKYMRFDYIVILRSHVQIIPNE